MKPKFDGYAAKYDAWFMENDNLFQSELRLFQRALGDMLKNNEIIKLGGGRYTAYVWNRENER